VSTTWFPGSSSDLAAALRQVVRGEVDDGTRRRAEYSTDASNYRVVPRVVVAPVDTDDVLAALAVARDAQVLVVTHFAQVAAFADHHVVVSKTVEPYAGSPGGAGAAASGSHMGITVTGVREVTGDERVRELARMLSGQQDSATARQHAVELIEKSLRAASPMATSAPKESAPETSAPETSAVRR